MLSVATDTALLQRLAVIATASIEKRTSYFRSLTAMTIGHEVAHAIDFALGGGVYRSGFDPRIRASARRTRPRGHS